MFQKTRGTDVKEAKERRCGQCQKSVDLKNWARHQRAHVTYGSDQQLRGRPRAQKRQTSTSAGAFPVRMVGALRHSTNRIYPLACLGVSSATLDRIIRDGAPTLPPIARKSCIVTAQVIISKIKASLGTVTVIGRSRRPLYQSRGKTEGGMSKHGASCSTSAQVASGEHHEDHETPGLPQPVEIDLDIGEDKDDFVAVEDAAQTAEVSQPSSAISLSEIRKRYVTKKGSGQSCEPPRAPVLAPVVPALDSRTKEPAVATQPRMSERPTASRTVIARMSPHRWSSDNRSTGRGVIRFEPYGNFNRGRGGGWNHGVCRRWEPEPNRYTRSGGQDDRVRSDREARYSGLEDRQRMEICVRSGGQDDRARREGDMDRFLETIRNALRDFKH